MVNIYACALSCGKTLAKQNTNCFRYWICTSISQHLFCFFCEGFEDEIKYIERTFEVHSDLQCFQLYIVREFEISYNK